MRCMVSLLVVLLFLTLSPSCNGSNDMLLDDNLEKDPSLMGWVYEEGPDPAATYVPEGRFGSHCLSYREGTWTTPAIRVKPFEFYRVTFHSKAEGRQYWSAYYYNDKGEQIVADHYWSIDPSETWIRTVYCTRARYGATHVRIRFSPLDRKLLSVDDVKVEAISRADATKWADEMYASIPPVKYEADPNRWKYLPRTMNKLRDGKPVRIVILGDSIANDTGNGPFDLFIERMYPGAHVEVIASVKGGAGTHYYKDENRVQQYVVDYKPHLLIIAGISNGSKEATRSVIKQVRAKIDPEIIIATGAVCRGSDPTTNKDWGFELRGGYRKDLKDLVQEEQCEFIDFYGPWGRYIADSGRPLEWFQRDVTHANMRGALVLSKILEGYFAPKK